MNFLLPSVLAAIKKHTKVQILTNTHDMSLWISGMFYEFDFHILRGRDRAGVEFVSICLAKGIGASREYIIKYREDIIT